MQYHLVYDPKDREYTVLLKSGNTYYYSLSWLNSPKEVLAKFNGFLLDPERDVTNESLIARLQTLAIFTPDSHPEYFL
jgi:hypothetical protein